MGIYREWPERPKLTAIVISPGTWTEIQRDEDREHYAQVEKNHAIALEAALSDSDYFKKEAKANALRLNEARAERDYFKTCLDGVNSMNATARFADAINPTLKRPTGRLEAIEARVSTLESQANVTQAVESCGCRVGEPECCDKCCTCLNAKQADEVLDSLRFAR